MADTTDVLGIPFPSPGDDNDVQADLEAAVTRVDEVPGVEALTSAEIAALTSGQKPTGRVVYNTTTSKLQQWSGSAWVDVDAAALAAAALKLPLAGGTMSGAVAMGGYKVTGLGNGSASGDAVNKGQLDEALPKAGGTMSGAIAMGSNKVTGLAKGTATGDAVARQQIQSGVTASIASSALEVISFSPAFASAPQVVACAVSPTGAGPMSVTSVTTTGALIFNGGALSAPAVWIAVGN